MRQGNVSRLVEMTEGCITYYIDSSLSALKASLEEEAEEDEESNAGTPKQASSRTAAAVPASVAPADPAAEAMLRQKRALMAVLLIQKWWNRLRSDVSAVRLHNWNRLRAVSLIQAWWRLVWAKAQMERQEQEQRRNSAIATDLANELASVLIQQAQWAGEEEEQEEEKEEEQQVKREGREVVEGEEEAKREEGGAVEHMSEMFLMGML